MRRNTVTPRPRPKRTSSRTAHTSPASSPAGSRWPTTRSSGRRATHEPGRADPDRRERHVVVRPTSAGPPRVRRTSPRQEITMKPRIFLGSSGQQAKLLESLTRGLEQVADVEPWTTTFNPGTSTLERLVELTREVDFAAFVFAQDDWTSHGYAPGQAAPRDNVVFEAGLFGGVLGMRRTFILHASGAKLPSDLLGLTCVRYAETTPTEIKTINQKLRSAIETEGRLARIEGLWWQHSLTVRTEREPSAVS